MIALPNSRSLLVSIAALLTTSTVLFGQSALDGFDPNANDSINVLVVQSDGKVLVGGDFTTLSPNGGPTVTRNRIARLNSDGTLDTAFDPNANSSVYSIAVQADGKILVGGYFTNIGGQTRNRIARLDPTTGLADEWNPNANEQVWSIVVQPDGRVLVGGLFDSIGGQTRKAMARLSGITGDADSFDANLQYLDDRPAVRSIVVQADSKILVGGYFKVLDQSWRRNIVRLNPDATADINFNPALGGLDPYGTVSAIAVQADGKVLLAGNIGSVDGQVRPHVARVNGTTGAPDSWDPNVSISPNPYQGIVSIVVQPDGMILAGGGFTSIGGQARHGIARLDAVSGAADSFNPNGDSLVQSIAVQEDGKILVGG